MYSKVQPENVALIVANVHTRLNLRRVLSFVEDLGVHIVLIKNYAQMRTTVMLALKNHSRRIQKQNIGARQKTGRRRPHEMYSKIRTKNMGLIVANVITRLNLRRIVSFVEEIGVHIVVFRQKNYAIIRTVILALKDHSRRIQKQNIGAIQT